jgi:hypothetical protein
MQAKYYRADVIDLAIKKMLDELLDDEDINQFLYHSFWYEFDDSLETESDKSKVAND